MMSHLPVQSINAEELPAEDYNFIKTQQDIYNLCRAIEDNAALKSEIEQTNDVDSFLRIAVENGYEFTASDLQIALNLALGNTYISSDEFDDYELDEEELEAVAGGGRAATMNSYWHSTGIDVDGQCFYLLQQSTDQRQVVVNALQAMDTWTWLGNNSVQVSDSKGKLSSYTISGITANGAFTQNLSTLDPTKWQVVST